MKISGTYGSANRLVENPIEEVSNSLEEDDYEELKETTPEKTSPSSIKDCGGEVS